MNRLYDCSPRIAPRPGQPRSESAAGDDLMRIMPRGVRTALIPLAKGQATIDDVPDFALAWLEKHDAIQPAKKAGVTWKHGSRFNTLLHRVAERHK